MKRWIATTGLALLFAGAAAADPDGAPAVDLTATWASIDQKIAADTEQKIAADTERNFDASVERALREQVEKEAAVREVSACRFATSPAEGARLSATERHRRLTDCLAQRHAQDPLVAAHPTTD